MAFKDDEERRAYFREYNKGWYQQHKDRLLEKRRQHDKDLRMWLSTTAALKQRSERLAV